MAAACLGGLPEAISVLMFWTNAFSVGECLIGMVLFGCFSDFDEFVVGSFLGSVFSVVNAQQLAGRIVDSKLVVVSGGHAEA